MVGSAGELAGRDNPQQPLPVLQRRLALLRCGRGSLPPGQFQRLHRGDRPGRQAALEQRTPLSVALSAADHAASYLFLASDGAAGMTGEILRNDGGLLVR